MIIPDFSADRREATNQNGVFTTGSVAQSVALYACFLPVYLLLINYAATVIGSLIIWATTPVTNVSQRFNGPIYDNFMNCFYMHSLWNFSVIFMHPLVYFFLCCVYLISAGRFIFQRWRNNHVTNNGEYGKARFTTPDEVRHQYQRIPDRNQSFPGYGGLPVMHDLRLNVSGMHLLTKLHNVKWLSWLGQGSEKVSYPGYYYIDQDTVNSIIIGITRAGKGEEIVFPMINILARAEKKASMVIGDVKGELSTATANYLKKQGYDVEILNLQNTAFSMSYNPLARIIDFAQNEDYSQLNQTISEFANSIYGNPNAAKGNEKFWTESSISLLSALIYGLIYEAKENDDWDKVNMRNIFSMLTELGGNSLVVDPTTKKALSDEEIANGAMGQTMNKLSLYFDALAKINQRRRDQGLPTDRIIDQATMMFSQSNFSGGETQGNIYSSAMAPLQVYVQDSIAKLTAKNSLRLTKVGFPRLLSVKFAKEYANRLVNISITQHQKVLEERQILTNATGLLSVPVKAKLPNDFQIALRFTDSGESLQLKGQKVFAKQGLGKIKTGADGKPIIKQVNLTKMTGDLIYEKAQFDYSEKPVAVFILMPPNRASYSPILSFFIHELFQANLDMANMVDRKMVNRIHFLIDEFGNLPKIPQFSTMLSLGLGYEILFTIIVQNLEQITRVYGKDDAQTILSNLGNTLYLKTDDKQTATEISARLGNRTIRYKTVNSNNKLSVWSTGHNNWSMKKQPLLDPNQLYEFKVGEAVILRSTHAHDNRGKAIASHPIFNYGNTAYPQRWQFMGDVFDNSATIADIQINSPHRNLDLNSVSLNWQQLFDQVRHDTGHQVANQNTPTTKSVKQVTRPTSVLTNEELNDPTLLHHLSEKLIALCQLNATNPRNDLSSQQVAFIQQICNHHDDLIKRRQTAWRQYLNQPQLLQRNLGSNIFNELMTETYTDQFNHLHPLTLSSELVNQSVVKTDLTDVDPNELPF